MNPAADLPLRDIHLPEPLSWWPPAPGWWALIALILMLGLASILLYRRYRKQAPARAARRALNLAFARYAQDRDRRAFLTELSMILRRTALSHFPRREVAGLAGSAWLAFLDQGLARTGLMRGFSEGPGRVLAIGPYSPNPDVDADALRTLCDAWVRELERGRRR